MIIGMNGSNSETFILYLNTENCLVYFECGVYKTTVERCYLEQPRDTEKSSI